MRQLVQLNVHGKNVISTFFGGPSPEFTHLWRQINNRAWRKHLAKFLHKAMAGFPSGAGLADLGKSWSQAASIQQHRPNLMGKSVVSFAKSMLTLEIWIWCTVNDMKQCTSMGITQRTHRNESCIYLMDLNLIEPKLILTSKANLVKKRTRDTKSIKVDLVQDLIIFNSSNATFFLACCAPACKLHHFLSSANANKTPLLRYSFNAESNKAEGAETRQPH